MNLDDGIAGIVLAAEHLLQLEPIDAGHHRFHLLAELLEGFAVTLLGQLEEELRLVDPFTLLTPAVNDALDACALAGDPLRTLGVVPEIRSGSLPAQLGRLRLETRQVKGASRATRCARATTGLARAAPRAPWPRP
jgi:hypothetical protein